MTQKRKVLLITLALVFFSGLIVSYKNFQVSQDYRQQLHKQTMQDVAYWASEVLMEKVKILEASVATLDKSTVQILKRMDVRYFAYAFKSEGQWKIKWRVIGDIEKKALVREVNGIPFSELSNSKRNWFNEKEKMALVSPVEIAKSEQLNNGFLVFGLQPDFFSGIIKTDPNFEIFSFRGKQARSLMRDKKSDWLIDSDLMGDEASTNSLNLEHEGVSYKASSYFASDVQLWLVYLSRAKITPFIASVPFYYFLIAMALCFALVLVFFTQLTLATEANLVVEEQQDQERAEEKGSFLQGLSLPRVSLGSLWKTKKDLQAVTKDMSWMDGVSLSESPDKVSDLSAWIEEILNEYETVLLQKKIQLHLDIPAKESVLLHKEPVKEFLCRLIENSIQTLTLEKEKSIQIQVLNESGKLKLNYGDSRSRHLPSIEDPAYLLEIDKPMEDINGIISYGRWLFSKSMESKTRELSVSLELIKGESLPAVAEPQDSQRIVIEDKDEISLEQFGFKEVSTTPMSEEVAAPKDESYAAQSIDDIVNSFEMSDFEFKNEEIKIEDSQDKELVEEVIAEQKEVVQFQAGDFKIKIRAPKKKDDDVHC